MEDAIADYDKLKKERSVKKGLLTRSVNKLRSVVNRRADAQADKVDSARCRARQMLEEIEEIHVQMETVLLEWDIAYEQDDEDAARTTARMADIDSNVQKIAAREAEVDKLQIEWSQRYAPSKQKKTRCIGNRQCRCLSEDCGSTPHYHRQAGMQYSEPINPNNWDKSPEVGWTV